MAHKVILLLCKIIASFYLLDKFIHINKSLLIKSILILQHPITLFFPFIPSQIQVLSSENPLSLLTAASMYISIEVQVTSPCPHCLLKQTDPPLSRRHYLPIAAQLGIRLHETLLYECWAFFWLNSFHILKI